MGSYLIVFFGAGIGGALRHAVNLAGLRLMGPGFPYATMGVNIVGSFVMGLLGAWFALRGETTMAWRLFLTTGILGGFTTFSAFSLDAVLLWERGEVALAAAYTLGSVILSVGALMTALVLVRHLT